MVNFELPSRMIHEKTRKSVEVNAEVRIGTCGFGMSQAEYARVFSCVEVQHTFYQPPRITTLERWRKQMPPEFEFVLKAWQLITHDAKSPTYRRLKRTLTDTDKQDAGYFRPTTIVEEAWEATAASARALNAKTVLFQCPASFTPTRQNIESLDKFFSTIDRHGLTFAWEPRGEWGRDLIKSICTSLELWHVVDPFLARTVTPDKCYFRLHGRNGWRYQYSNEELSELADILPQEGPGYVFFNNSKMTEDATRLKRSTNGHET
jgi:uncharacterized protein YecE (DUF72 family)